MYNCWAGKIEVQTTRDKDNWWLSEQTEADYSSICIDLSDDNLPPPYVDPYANAFVLNDCFKTDERPEYLFAMHVVCILIC